jgi:hypothetical protein
MWLLLEVFRYYPARLLYFDDLVVKLYIASRGVPKMVDVAKNHYNQKILLLKVLKAGPRWCKKSRI